MTIKRILSILLGTLGLKILAAGVGNLGETLDQAKQTEFFRWFHLDETGRTARVVHFKPSGDKFHNLVTLNLALDTRGRLAGAELILLRSFVDSGRDGMFARDIAKSFVRVVTPAEERDTVADLLAEIEQPPANLSQTLIVGTRTTPRPPAKSTPGYQVFLGQRASYQQGPIKLMNRVVNNAPCLVIGRGLLPII
jgi:hypothetical protein